MELVFLNENFQVCGDAQVITFLNLQWYRKYYEVGTFSIYMTLDNYYPEAVYIYTKDRPELGVIEKIIPEIEGNKQHITLSGHFAECLINDKIAYPAFYGTDSLEASTKACITQFVDDIDIFAVGDTLGYDETQTWQTTGKALGDRTYSLWSPYGKSYRVIYDWIDNTLTFDLWQGKDRTQDQTVNNYVTFSAGFRNMNTAIVTIDKTIYKNYITVIGLDSDGETAVPVVVDRSNGGYKKQMYYYSSIQYDPDEQLYSEFIASLTTEGEEKLNETIVATSVEVQSTNTPFAYLSDYDLGDKINVVVDAVNLSFTARITGVREVIKKNSHDVSLEIGDQKITKYKRMEYRQ